MNLEFPFRKIGGLLAAATVITSIFMVASVLAFFRERGAVDATARKIAANREVQRNFGEFYPNIEPVGNPQTATPRPQRNTEESRQTSRIVTVNYQPTPEEVPFESLERFGPQNPDPNSMVDLILDGPESLPNLDFQTFEEAEHLTPTKNEEIIQVPEFSAIEPVETQPAELHVSLEIPAPAKKTPAVSERHQRLSSAFESLKGRPPENLFDSIEHSSGERFDATFSTEKSVAGNTTQPNADSQTGELHSATAALPGDFDNSSPGSSSAAEKAVEKSVRAPEVSHSRTDFAASEVRPAPEFKPSDRHKTLVDELPLPDLQIPSLHEEIAFEDPVDEQLFSAGQTEVSFRQESNIPQDPAKVGQLRIPGQRKDEAQPQPTPVTPPAELAETPVPVPEPGPAESLPPQSLPDLPVVPDMNSASDMYAMPEFYPESTSAEIACDNNCPPAGVRPSKGHSHSGTSLTVRRIKKHMVRITRDLQLPKVRLPQLDRPDFMNHELPRLAAPEIPRPKFAAPFATRPHAPAPRQAEPQVARPAYFAPPIAMPHFTAPQFSIPEFLRPQSECQCSACDDSVPAPTMMQTLNESQTLHRVMSTMRFTGRTKTVE